MITALFSSCSHTKNEGINWWSAKFDEKYIVEKIVIYNRVDNDQNRINGAKVMTNNAFVLGERQIITKIPKYNIISIQLESCPKRSTCNEMISAILSKQQHQTI